MKFENTGKVMKRLRAEVGLTQAELANKLGLHSQYISNLENAKCFVPKKRLEKLCKSLKLQDRQVKELMSAAISDDINHSELKWKKAFSFCGKKQESKKTL